jgi:hypothetical protein
MLISLKIKWAVRVSNQCPNAKRKSPHFGIYERQSHTQSTLYLQRNSVKIRLGEFLPPDKPFD